MIYGKPVPELDNQLRKTVRYSLFILAGVFLLLAFHPQNGIVWGAAVGIMVGVYNSVTLARRIKNIPGLRPGAARKHMNWGLVFRLGLIMAVLFFISQRLPFINLLAVGAGILVPTYVSVTLSVAESMRLYRQSEAFLKKYYGK